MNVNAALKDVIIRIVKGEKVRVKQEYKDIVFDIMSEDYSAIKITAESEDDQYCYIRKIQDIPPGFTPEDMARAVHDCNGNPVTNENGVTTGYNFKGLIESNATSKQCFARQVVFTDSSKNEYYIGTNKGGGLMTPTGIIDHGRTGWIRCNKSQFDRYLTALRSGRDFELRQLRSELNVN